MDLILENGSALPSPSLSKYGQFKSEFKSHIGIVVDLTEKKLKQGVKAGSHFFNKGGLAVLGLASSVNFTVLTILNQIRELREEHSESLEHFISGIAILGGALNILSLINLIHLSKAIKEFPELLRSAKKIDEIGKAILLGLYLISKVLRVPTRIMQVLAPFFENFHIDLLNIVDFSKWAPFLGAVSLALSTASSALKIWNIYDILRFANKMKRECCLELIRNLEDDLKKEFKDNKMLLDKIDLALAEAKSKELKSLHKKKHRFSIKLSKKKGVDLKILKKEIKKAAREKAAGDPNSEIVDQLDRSAKLAYISIISKYDIKKLNMVYHVDGNEVQSAAKKTVELVKTLIGQEEINQADEKLSMAYRELKGRITYQTFSDKMAVAVGTISMASSVIFLAISFGTLPTPAAPAGAALGVISAALATVRAFMDRYKNVTFQENIGITQLKLQEKLKKKLEKIEEDAFITQLNEKQTLLFNLVKKQIQDENYHHIIYYRFAVPKITKHSTKKERAHQQAIKKMNRIIETMNTRSKQQRVSQERVRTNYWKKALGKIDPGHLPASYAALQMDMIQIIDKKEGERIANLQVIPIQDNWSNQEKIAIKSLNKLIESMRTSAYKHYENRIVNLTSGIEILKSKLDEKDNEATKVKLTKWQKELEVNNRIFSKIQLNEQKSSTK